MSALQDTVPCLNRKRHLFGCRAFSPRLPHTAVEFSPSSETSHKQSPAIGAVVPYALHARLRLSHQLLVTAAASAEARRVVPMATPSKKPRRTVAATGVAASPSGLDTINRDYLADLQASLNVIHATWPDIASIAPLPETGRDGHLRMTGFMSPFNPTIYDARYREGDGMAYTCGCNFFWHNPLLSPMPWVPLYKTRVMELAKGITPGLLKHPLVWHANFATGSKLPAGGCVRVSPDEAAHALVFKLAERLGDSSISEQETSAWLRTVLSCPVTFKRLGVDDVYAEANSLRQDIQGTARVVKHSVRQLVYNIQGFKVQHEKGGNTCGAKEIAKFWAERIRLSAGQEFMAKPGTIDTCLTIYNRLFSVPECEQMLLDSESIYGADGPWSSIWTLQELISRCGSKPKMVWVMAAINDWLRQGKIEIKDVSSTTMKTGTKSLTDVALTTFALKHHLLGPWLEGKDIPSNIKETSRDIFASHSAYRSKYNPFDGTIDTNWLFTWPKVGSMLLSFFEQTLFLHTGNEDQLMRQA